jgi:Tol biopolymer transport system component
MSYKAIYTSTLLLLFGFILGASLLLVAQPSWTAPTPVPTSTEWVIVPSYPTFTATPVTQLPPNCIGGYGVQLVSAPLFPAAAPPLPSPDGLSSVYTEAGNVYLESEGRAPITLQDGGTFAGSLDIFGHWSPDGRYLAWVDSYQFVLTVIEAAAGSRTVVAQLEFPSAFLGWSPDGRYLAYNQHYLSDITVWGIDQQRVTYTSAVPGRDWLIQYGLFWSPDGDWLIFSWRDNSHIGQGQDAPHGFTLAAAGGSSVHDILLTDQTQPAEPFRQQVIWSPGGAAFALTYLQFAADQYLETVQVYGIDGVLLGDVSTPIVQPVYSDLMLWTTDWTAVKWSSDGQSLTYIRPVESQHFALLGFDLDTDKFVTLTSDLDRPPFPAPAGDYIALYHGFDQPFSVDVLDTLSKQLVPLVSGASDSGDPDWSPDGQWIAAVWAAGEGSDRRVFLSWMRPDGSQRHDLDASFRDVTDLRWISNQELAYLAWRGDEANIEIVNLFSGEQRALPDTFSQVTDFALDSDADTLSFWWVTAAGERGRDTYDFAGTRLNRLYYDLDLELPRREFWSPDGTIVAIKVGALYNRGISAEALVLAFADGRPPILLRSGLSGLGDPLWSPDSASLTFTQSRDRSPASLHRVDTSGINQWEYAPFESGWIIDWTACE